MIIHVATWRSYDCGNSMPAMSIETLRELRGLSQEDLAEMAQISQSTMSRAEALDGSVTLKKFQAIADALKVPLADLFATDRTAREAALLTAYRALSDDRRAGWDDIVIGVLSQRDQSVQSQDQVQHQSSPESLP